MADPDRSSPDLLWRAERARAHSEALREQVVRTAEAVAEVEREVVRVHEVLAAPGGLVAEQAREHADRARDVAAKERAEAERWRRAAPG